MEIEKTFLETLKQIFENLKEEGMITQEEIEKGFNIPLLWLASSGINRDAIIGALRNLYEREHPNNRYPLNRFKRYASLIYSEKQGVPLLEVLAGKSSIFITDQEMESEKFRRNVSTKDLIEEVPKFKKRLKIIEIMNQNNISLELATNIVEKNVFDEKQMQSELYATPHFLKEMAINFGDYYKYLQKEKQQIEEIQMSEVEDIDGPIETRGGLIEQVADVIETPRMRRDEEAPGRVSDIYPFEQRDEIFRKLKPKRIITYDGLDRNRQVVKDAFTLYLYKNPQEHDGYLGVSEPFDGDKEVRAFYLTTELIDGLKEDEDLDKFWHTIGEMYISMPRSEFAKEKGTYTFRHTGDLESYAQKMEGVIKELVNNNPQSVNVRRASLVLFGIDKYKQIIGGTTRGRLKKAKEAVFGDKQIEENKEGDARDDQ